MSPPSLPPVGGGRITPEPDFEGSSERTLSLRKIDPQSRTVSGPLAGLAGGRQAAGREPQTAEPSGGDPYREATDLVHDRLTKQWNQQRLDEARHGREPARAIPKQLADAFNLMRQNYSLEESARTFGIERPEDIEELRAFAERNIR
jgi:hypothetical protein